jgi:hypothetical protein
VWFTRQRRAANVTPHGIAQPSLILLAAFVFRVQLERPLQITEPLIPIKVN